MFLSGKRGQVKEEIAKKVFEALMLAAFVGLSMYFVNGAIQDDAIVHERFVRDNALLLDAMHGSQGNAHISYTVKEGINLTFLNHRVSTSQRWFPYATSDGINSFEEPVKVRGNYSLIKQGNNIRVEDE